MIHLTCSVRALKLTKNRYIGTCSTCDLNFPTVNRSVSSHVNLLAAVISHFLPPGSYQYVSATQPVNVFYPCNCYIYQYFLSSINTSTGFKGTIQFIFTNAAKNCLIMQYIKGGQTVYWRFALLLERRRDRRDFCKSSGF